MTAQAPLPLVPAEGRAIGAVACLVEGADGGRVFIRGELAFAFDVGDEAGRRLAAVQLVRIKAATVKDVAAGFGVNQATVWRWGRRIAEAGVIGLTTAQRGPKGPSKLTSEVVARIVALHEQGQSMRSVARTVGVSLDSVRRALASHDDDEHDGRGDHGLVVSTGADGVDERGDEEDPQLPVLADPPARGVERGLARWGRLDHARPVFIPCARAPLAGLFLALPGLATTGLLEGARSVVGPLPGGFYGLEATLLEAVLRTLAGQPRAEGAARLDPAALGRVLGFRTPDMGAESVQGYRLSLIS